MLLTLNPNNQTFSPQDEQPQGLGTKIKPCGLNALFLTHWRFTLLSQFRFGHASSPHSNVFQ